MAHLKSRTKKYLENNLNDFFKRSSNPSRGLACYACYVFRGVEQSLGWKDKVYKKTNA